MPPTLDENRAAELSGLIQRLDVEIPIQPKLLALVNQALTHGRPVALAPGTAGIPR